MRKRVPGTNLWEKLEKFVPGTLFILTALIYVNVVNAPFHFDDMSLLLENPHIRSFSGLCSDLGTDQRKFLTFLTFATNFKINPFDPTWYRLVNILLHFLTAVFAAKALQYLFRAPFFQGQDQSRLSMIAWSAAFIFCVHPLQTDSVTYIWQRSEVLSGFFYAVLLVCYWKGRVQRNWRFVLYAACFFAIGLYAKGSVMSAPLLIGISELMFFNAEPRVLKNKGKCVIAGAGVIAAALLLDHIFFQVNFSVNARYFYTQCLVIWKYLQLTFFPIGQSVDHGYTWVNSVLEPRALVGFLGLLALGAAIVALSRKYRVACFGALWFFVYLLPTSSAIPLLTPIFEHRLYFSLVGFGLVLSDIIFRVFRSNERIAYFILIGIICGLSVLTVLRNQLWQSRTALMEDAVKKSPDYVRPYFTLGSYYMEERRLDDAEKMFRKCVELNPYFADAYNNLGVIVDMRGSPGKAVELYRKAIRHDPDFQDAYLNLAHSYYTAGRIDLSWDWIAKILKRRPDHRVYAYAAYLHMKAGNLDVAQQLLAKGFSKDPASAKLFYVQGLMDIRLNDLSSAADALNKAAYYAPQWFQPFNDLGVVYFMQKKYALAKEALERAHALQPRNAKVYLNLANTYHELGEYHKAEKAYQTSQYQGMLHYLPKNFDGKELFDLD